MKESVNWSIKLSSHCETDLNHCEVLEVLSSYDHEEYQSFKSNFHTSLEESVGDSSIGKWQIKKSAEIQEKWHRNLKHDLENGKLSISTTFETSLPESFEHDDVIYWTEGFNRLGKIWPMLCQGKIIKGDYNEELTRKQLGLIEDLMSNENFDIKKL
jgi:hypothetical protein